jgi:tetratricopeptide (TPR) repeat protein
MRWTTAFFVAGVATLAAAPAWATAPFSLTPPAPQHRKAVVDCVSHAVAAANRTDIDAAIRLCGEAIATDTLTRDERDTVLVQRAFLYSRTGALDHASTDIDDALNLNPDFVQALYVRAGLRAARRDYAGALADIDRVIQLSPPSDEPLRLRALVHRDMGDLPSALADVDAAIKLKGDNAETHRLRGELLVRLRRPADAMADLGEAIKLHPSPQTYQARGQARIQMGDIDAGLGDYDAAVALDPQSPDLLGLRCTVRTLAKHFTDAQADCEKALELSPRNPRVMAARALLEASQRRFVTATNWMDKALAILPNDPSLLEMRASFRASSGDPIGAAADAARAHAIRTGQPVPPAPQPTPQPIVRMPPAIMVPPAPRPRSDTGRGRSPVMMRPYLPPPPAAPLWLPTRGVGMVTPPETFGTETTLMAPLKPEPTPAAPKPLILTPVPSAKSVAPPSPTQPAVSRLKSSVDNGRAVTPTTTPK